MQMQELRRRIRDNQVRNRIPARFIRPSTFKEKVETKTQLILFARPPGRREIEIGQDHKDIIARLKQNTQSRKTAASGNKVLNAFSAGYVRTVMISDKDLLAAQIIARAIA